MTATSWRGWSKHALPLKREANLHIFSKFFLCCAYLPSSAYLTLKSPWLDSVTNCNTLDSDVICSNLKAWPILFSPNSQTPIDGIRTRYPLTMGKQNTFLLHHPGRWMSIKGVQSFNAFVLIFFSSSWMLKLLFDDILHSTINIKRRFFLFLFILTYIRKSWEFVCIILATCLHFISVECSQLLDCCLDHCTMVTNFH